MDMVNLERKHLHALLRLSGTPLHEHANDVSIHRSNLAGSLRGARAIPKDVRIKLMEHAGFRHGLPDKDRVHFWVTGRNEIHLSEALAVFFPKGGHCLHLKDLDGRDGKQAVTILFNEVIRVIVVSRAGVPRFDVEQLTDTPFTMGALAVDNLGDWIANKIDILSFDLATGKQSYGWTDVVKVAQATGKSIGDLMALILYDRAKVA